MADKTSKPLRKPHDVEGTIRRSFAKDGTRIVHVPLANGLRATVDAADFDRLMRLGLRPTWVFNDNGRGCHFVRSRFPLGIGTPNNIQVARAIMAPPPGCVVKYSDGNPLNLRRNNLWVVERASRAKAREQFWEMQAAA